MIVMVMKMNCRICGIIIKFNAKRPYDLCDGCYNYKFGQMKEIEIKLSKSQLKEIWDIKQKISLTSSESWSDYYKKNKNKKVRALFG